MSSLTILDLREARWAPAPGGGCHPARRAVGASAHVAEAVSELGAGYRRLTSGTPWRDLSPLIQDRMFQVAWYLYDMNPMGRRLINLVTEFVLGEGVRIVADDPAVGAWLERFWRDPVNAMDLTLAEYVRELALFGEQCYTAVRNPASGEVRLGYVDPFEIDEVVHGTFAAGELAVPIEVVLKKNVLSNEPPRRLKIIRREEDPASPSFGRLAGDCFFFAINKARRATRGRSDIFALADWLDAYEQMLFDQVDRSQLLNVFVWDVLLKGKTQEEIDEWLKTQGRPPRRASLRAHNENVEWRAVAPSLGGQDMTDTARLFKNHILGGAGFPEHWFAEGGQTNLATAVEMGTPTFKMLSERQRYVIHLLRAILDYVIDSGMAAGSLAEDANRRYEIVVPDLSVRDTSRLAAALAQVVAALEKAETAGWVRKATAARIFAALATQLGVDVNPDEEIGATQ